MLLIIFVCFLIHSFISKGFTLVRWAMDPETNWGVLGVTLAQDRTQSIYVLIMFAGLFVDYFHVTAHM